MTMVIFQILFHGLERIEAWACVVQYNAVPGTLLGDPVHDGVIAASLQTMYPDF